MKSIFAVALCPVAFGRFAFLDQGMSVPAAQDPSDSLFSNLLGDINFDISFPPLSTISPDATAEPEHDALEVDEVEEVGVDSVDSVDPDTFDLGERWQDPMMMDPDEMFIDESPSSMLSSFDSFGHFGGLFDRIRSASPFTGSGVSDFTQYRSPPARPKPLYLMVQSLGDRRDQMLQSMDTDSFSSMPWAEGAVTSSVFRLQHSNRVNGNTYRYTIQSDGGNQPIFTESWSTPTASKMYLCSSESCDSENGLEMMDILGDWMSAPRPRSYFHLVPTTTEEVAAVDMDQFLPLEMQYESGDAMDDGLDDSGWNWMDFAMERARGCHERMQRLKEWYFGGETESKEMGMEMEGDFPSVELIVDERPYDRYWPTSTARAEGGVYVIDVGYDDEEEVEVEGEDMLFGMASMVMMVMSTLGVFYSCYRFRMARLQMKRYDPSDYIIMHETDEFQGEER